MPAFVKTPKDEVRWSKAKEHASKQVKHGSDDFYRLANYIYHKLGKTKEDVQKAEALLKDLIKPPAPTTSVKAPMKVGSTAVKMPKSKKMPDPFGKPSLFFKKEDFEGIKHPSVEKLRAFLERARSKRNL